MIALLKFSLMVFASLPIVILTPPIVTNYPVSYTDISYTITGGEKNEENTYFRYTISLTNTGEGYVVLDRFTFKDPNTYYNNRPYYGHYLAPEKKDVFVIDSPIEFSEATTMVFNAYTSEELLELDYSAGESVELYELYYGVYYYRIAFTLNSDTRYHSVFLNYSYNEGYQTIEGELTNGFFTFQSSEELDVSALDVHNFVFVRIRPGSESNLNFGWVMIFTFLTLIFIFVVLPALALFLILALLKKARNKNKDHAI